MITVPATACIAAHRRRKPFDVDELARIPGVTLDRARLAELEEGLGALQRQVAALDAQLRELRRSRAERDGT